MSGGECWRLRMLHALVTLLVSPEPSIRRACHCARMLVTACWCPHRRRVDQCYRDDHRVLRHAAHAECQRGHVGWLRQAEPLDVDLGAGCEAVFQAPRRCPGLASAPTCERLSTVFACLLYQCFSYPLSPAENHQRARIVKHVSSHTATAPVRCEHAPRDRLWRHTRHSAMYANAAATRPTTH